MDASQKRTLQEKRQQRLRQLRGLRSPVGNAAPALSLLPSPPSPAPSVLLGRDVETDQEVPLEQKQRLRGFYGIGIPGSGKTTLLINMILQDIEQGMGVCSIDVHGDATKAILARIPEKRLKDVILFNPFDEN